VTDGLDVSAHTVFIISQSHSVEVRLNRPFPVRNLARCIMMESWGDDFKESGTGEGV